MIGGDNMKLLIEFYTDEFDPAVLDGFKFEFENNKLTADGTLSELVRLLAIVNENSSSDKFVHIW